MSTSRPDHSSASPRRDHAVRVVATSWLVASGIAAILGGAVLAASTALAAESQASASKTSAKSNVKTSPAKTTDAKTSAAKSDATPGAQKTDAPAAEARAMEAQAATDSPATPAAMADAPAKAETSATAAKAGAAGEKAAPIAKTVSSGSRVASHPAGGKTARPVSAPSIVVTQTMAPQDERVTYQYNALGRRDPFQPLVGGGFVGAQVLDAPPDVGGLKVVGIVWGSEDKFALVEDPRGTSLVLRAGDKVMNGVVETLKRDAMVVKLSIDGQTQLVAIPLTRKGDSAHESE